MGEGVLPKALGADVAGAGVVDIGALFALYFTNTHFSVSSGIGMLALFGVAVETGVIMITPMPGATPARNGSSSTTPRRSRST